VDALEQVEALLHGAEASRRSAEDGR